MNFIFMLTRNDATVADALEILPRLDRLGLGHIGFKDVGAAPETLRTLAAGIRQSGARAWMEIVSIGAAAERRSLALAREIGVEAVLGGTEIEAGLAELAGSGISYFPFIGRPEGHPTRLGGDAALVEAQARAAVARGAAGVDLLAYRAYEADPIELIGAARRGLGAAGQLVVAGSVSSPQRIAAIRAAGADAFTIGAAALEGVYAPGAGPLEAQLAAILADVGLGRPGDPRGNSRGR